MRAAFSLVELSIVLVILGLLTGGILSGQSLIRAAELRSVSTDVSRYLTAAYTFRDKYFAFPGDMPNATQFWGFVGGTTGTDAACYNATGTGNLTCNGNGNGQLLGASAANRYGESFMFWQHLKNAGLVEGNYTGKAGPNGSGEDVVAGENVPRSRIRSSAVFYAGTIADQTVSDGWRFPGSYGHVIGLGNDTNNSNFNGDSIIISTEDAWQIDTKMDDGKPGTGKVRSFTNSSRPTCADADDPATAVYQLTSTAPLACQLLFIIGR